MTKCRRKKHVWPNSNRFSRMLRAQQQTKHWPNLRHDDAACGAWGTWRIPMGGFASQKSMVTCGKCRRLCGLDGGPDLRKVVTDYKALDRRQKQQRKARERRRAQKIAEKLVSAWERCHEWYALDSTARARSMLVSLIAGAVLKERR